MPEPDDETCRRYYENNRARFRSPDIYEASHILFAALPADAQAYAQARADAAAVLAELREHPERFAALAQALFALSVGGAGRQSRPDHDRTDDARIRTGAASRSHPASCARRRSRRATASTSSGSIASIDGPHAAL